MTRRADTAIPEDGFVLAFFAATRQLANLKNITSKSIVHVHGVQTLSIDDYGITVNKIETAPTLDGVVTEEEGYTRLGC